MTSRDDFLRAAGDLERAATGMLPVNKYADMLSSTASLLREAAGMAEAIEQTECPRPCNGRPDDFTVAQCVAAKECGCIYGATSAKEEG